jgi:hypothetical protein
MRSRPLIWITIGLVIGCGRSPTESTAHISRSLTPKAKKSAAQTAATMDSVTTAIDEMSNDKAGTPIQLADLKPGKYTLTYLSSSFFSMDSSKSTETLRILHQTTDSNGVFNDIKAQQVGGSLSKDPKSSRTFSMPSEFTVTTPNWTPADTDKTIIVDDQLVMSGKSFSIKDTVVNTDSSTNKVSLLGILASGKDTMTADSNVPVKLKLLKLTDGKTLRVVLEFDEATPSTTQTTTSSENITAMRMVYIDYSLPTDP